MGTRGYRVTRFRGRYYRFFNRLNSYPEGLGEALVNEIPIDSKAYQQWLLEQRREALEWHDTIERFLCKKRPDYEDDNINTNDEVDDVEEDVESTTEDEYPWGVDTAILPDFTPAFNDVFIEWVYTIDLDKEVFTIDNGAHIQLSQIRSTAWIDALAHGRYGDRLLLPSSVPQEAITDLVVKLPSPSASMLQLYENLDVSIVEAQGLNVFPPTQRHGALFRAGTFYIFQSAYKDTLSAILLAWSPHELHFREIAYAILCLASASSKFSIVPLQQISQNGRIGYADLESTNGKSRKAEFLAHLGVGCHIEGFPPGSSPDSRMYWFDGTLIHLVAQLFHRPEVLIGAVACTVEYCQSQMPDQCVNAVLMSIEHIVLLRLYPGGRVERTELLPLFDIETHESMNASGRYCADFLDELQIRKGKAIKRREAEESQNEQSDSDENEGEEADSIEDQTSQTTFLALMSLLEVSSRQQIPPSSGIFPTEVYRGILLYLEDLETYHACMQVSRTFRILSQQNIMVMDDTVFQANDASKTYDQTTTSVLVPALRMRTVSTGRSREVVLKSVEADSISGLDWQEKNRYWQVVIGSERNRRSLLPGFAGAFDSIL